MAVGWSCTTIANGEQSVMIVGALLMPLLLVDKWDLQVLVIVTVLYLALDDLLRASGWIMWHAVGQSHGLLTAAILVLEVITVFTMKMLELFVQLVSWDGIYISCTEQYL